MTGIAIMLAAQALSSSASTPAKLIVMRGETGVAVTDYPTLARCESARAKLVAMVREYNASHPPEQLPNGGVIYTVPLNLSAICLPS